MMKGFTYNDYGEFLKTHFGKRVQKISINAGFTCPNRDGAKGTGGCTYCNNNSFIPDYIKPNSSITEQLTKGIKFFDKKKRIDAYLAYFQSYTNTYETLNKLKKLYHEALKIDRIVGLVISTRPDCLSNEILDLLENLSKQYFISVELGVESGKNSTLKFINRCHTYEDAENAIKKTTARGLHTGVHLILGLPGDSRKDNIETVVKISKLPISSLKLHHLQIIKSTYMSIQYKNDPQIFDLFSMDEYFELVIKIIQKVRPDIYFQRFISRTPLDLLIAPKWGGIKNFEFTHLIRKHLQENQIRQGMDYS